MKKIKYVILLTISIFLASCIESAEDRSLSLDHKVPSYKVLTDSLLVNKSDSVEIKVKVSDESGLSQVLFSYGDWLINEKINLALSPKEYLFQTKIKIPADAETEWQETITANDGTSKTITQHYHKLQLYATDVFLNVRIIPVYIRVQE